MKTTGERLQLAREQAGFRYASEFARFIGANEVTVRAHESDMRGLKPERAEQYAKALRRKCPKKMKNLNAAWFLYGGDAPFDVSKNGKKDTVRIHTNIDRIFRTFRQIPLIDYIQAGQWGGIADAFEPGTGEDMLTASGDCGPHTFALRVRGRSMEPDYREGDIIVVDPDINPEPGDFVVAKLDDTEEATFKKYRPRGLDDNGHEIIDLVPLNGDFPTIRLNSHRSGHICGTVIEHRRNPRRSAE